MRISTEELCVRGEHGIYNIYIRRVWNEEDPKSRPLNDRPTSFASFQNNGWKESTSTGEGEKREKVGRVSGETAAHTHMPTAKLCFWFGLWFWVGGREEDIRMYVYTDNAQYT